MYELGHCPHPPQNEQNRDASSQTLKIVVFQHFKSDLSGTNITHLTQYNPLTAWRGGSALYTCGLRPLPILILYARSIFFEYFDGLSFGNLRRTNVVTWRLNWVRERQWGFICRYAYTLLQLHNWTFLHLVCQAFSFLHTSKRRCSTPLMSTGSAVEALDAGMDYGTLCASVLGFWLRAFCS